MGTTNEKERLAHTLMGKGYLELGQINEAISFFDSSNDIDDLIELAKDCLEREQVNFAFDALEKVKFQVPKEILDQLAELLITKGNRLLEEKNETEALSIFKKAAAFI